MLRVVGGSARGGAPGWTTSPAKTTGASMPTVKRTVGARSSRRTGSSTVEPAPSAGQGWGLVRLDSVLPLPDNDRRLIVSDRPRTFFGGGDGPVRMTFDVVEAGTLEVVLAWTDPASSPQATSHLVNDLDLELRGPDGTFLGNVLTDGASTTGGEPDRTNNIEVVRLPAASPGRWEVRVSPAVLANPPQGYAVVVSGAVRSREPRRPAQRVASAAAVTAGAPASAPPSSHGTRTGDLLDPHPTP